MAKQGVTRCHTAVVPRAVALGPSRPALRTRLGSLLKAAIAPGLLLLCAVPCAAAAGLPGAANAHGKILWDSYGIPHVFAKNTAGLFFGFGYAQAQAHGNLLLHLYGESRGRAAEYWGPAFADSDRYLLANDVWRRAQIWYAQQSPPMRGYLDAFAAGINAYAAQHAESLSSEVRVVLPVSGVDVMAHWERVMEFLYLAPAKNVYGTGARTSAALPRREQTPRAGEEEEAAGSNAWAIAPIKTRDGHALLLSNPHLSWAPSYMTYFEAQLSAPGIEMYGATQVGFPVLRFAFDANHGFTNTVNPITAATVYELSLVDGGYRYDGKNVAFATEMGTLKVKQPDGAVRDEPVPLRRSIHGPVFERPDGRTVALRVAGLDRPFGIQEYWDLDRARNLPQFIGILKRLQIPMFNLIYADCDGRILYQYNGTVPVRTHGDFAYWSGLVPGDTSANLWTRIHPYEDLPRTLDPPSGWVQNTNNPPWVNTALPPLNPRHFPAYLAPVTMTFRAEQSELLLMSEQTLDFQDFVRLKMSTRSLLADRVLGALLDAAAASADDLVRRAAMLLRDWDHRYDAGSRAALLFERWAALFAGTDFLGMDHFAEAWSLDHPLATPSGLKDPAHAVSLLKMAAERTVADYGALDRPFGDVSRFHLGEVDLPGNGGFGNLGIFRVITWSPLEQGTRTPLHGETYISLIEFSKPMKAMGLLAYGESSQPGSPHRGDQLELLSKEQLRPQWLTRAEVEHHEESRMTY